jgi:hypothetical protein
MAKSNGWIKLHRSLLDSQAFKNEGLLKVWIWCLLKANHSMAWVSVQVGSGSTEVSVNPGQFIFGRHTAAKELHMKPSTVMDRVKKLSNMQNINIQSDTHYSIISIVNFDSYQRFEKDSDSQTDSQTDSGPTPSRHPADTNKKDKNDKKRDGGLTPLPSLPKSRKREVAFQEDFKLSDSSRQYAINHGVDPDRLFEKFRAYCLATGKKYVDWNRAFQVWVLNEKPGPANQLPPTQPPSKIITPEEIEALKAKRF